MNVVQLLARAAQSEGERVAVIQGTAPLWSYKELAKRVAALASSYRAQGMRPGDRVALLMSNTPEYVEGLFSCWAAGLIPTPINAKLHAREIAQVLADCEPTLALATPDMASVLNDAAAGSALEIVETGSKHWRNRLASEPIAFEQAGRDDPAWLFYTSGTTGRSKGAVLTHGNLLAMSAAYCSNVDHVMPEDGLLHAAPMSHGSGLYILPYVLGRARQIVPESGKFDPAEIFQILTAERNVSFFAAPTMVSRLVRAGAGADTSGLKTIVYGGGPMYVADCKVALDFFGPKLVQIYGQGETPMTITVLPKRMHADTAHPRYEARLASVGYAQSAVEVIVADAEDRPLPAGESGEILVRGSSVMKEYWRNPEASAETLRSGWLHTGDIGSFDEDGFLSLKDRSKDVIISGGSNVYPREVEEVLLKHDAVVEVAVIGAPHAEWGEVVVAFVVARRPVTHVALDALCLEHIAKFKRPKTYCFVQELPKNSYGKVLKTELRKRLAAP